MNDHDLAGKTKNYDFGYLPRDEKIPEGWVKTIRPCMGCSSSVTYIDKDKVWHCLKCGWSSDTVSDIEDEKENRMSRVYTKKEITLIAECIDEGMSVKQIAEKLGRPYQGVWAKVKEVKGMMGKVADSASEDIPYPTGVFYDSSNDELIRGGEQLKPTEAFKDVDYTRPYPTEEMEQMQKQISDLQTDLAEANRKLENAEANNKDLMLHTKRLDAQAKLYLNEANDYSLKLHKANNLVADLQEQLKSQQEYIQALEKPVSKIIPSRSISDTPHARISRALGKAEEAGMELRNINVCGMYAHFEFDLGLVGGVKPEGESIKDDETELPF